MSLKDLMEQEMNALPQVQEPRNKKNWTKSEDALLLKHRNLSDYAVGNILGRCPTSVSSRRNYLKRIGAYV